MNNFEFFGPNSQICGKKDLGFETEKNNVGIRFNIVERLCVSIFSQTGQLWLFWPKFAQEWIRSEIQKPNGGIRISIVKMPCVPIFRKNEKLWLLLPKNEFWGQNFKNLSRGLQSALPRYHVYQFSVKTDKFDFSGPKRKLGFEIQETNAGIRISILETPCVATFRQNGQLWIFGPRFAQK